MGFNFGLRSRPIRRQFCQHIDVAFTACAGRGGINTSRPIVLVLLVVSLAAASVASALSLGNAASVGTASDPTAAPIGQLNYKGMMDPVFAARVQHFLAQHGVNHPLRTDLHGLSPLDAAKATLHSEIRGGMTPSEWIGATRADHLLALEPDAPVSGDLVADLARLASAAGVPYTSAQLAELRASVTTIPVEVRQPFADLVHRVADVYEAQLPVASAMVAKATGASSAVDVIMPDDLRDVTVARSFEIVAAENAFRDAVGGVQATIPRFEDPEHLVILGSSGNDVYERTSVLRDPILIVDPSGDDTYHTTAAAACPASVLFVCNGLVVSTILDLTGDDVYSFSGAFQPAQGAGGLGGIGVLTDVAGNDHYSTSFTQLATGCPGMYLAPGSQGHGFAAAGILLDGTGNDVYVADVTGYGRCDAYDLSQGFGNVGGVGIFADGAGDNQVLDHGTPTTAYQGFQGLYPGGTGFYGGIGILSSTGLGSSHYAGWDNQTSTDFYAWGFGAFGGTGIFYEDGGNDDYTAFQDSTANRVEIPLLNCAYGTASYAGLGIFLDIAGNDRYFSDTRADTTAWTQSEGFGGPLEGEGLFVDFSGDDGHFMEAHPNHGPNQPQYTYGRGILFSGGAGATGDTAAIYLDLGGADTYTGAAPSRDNGAWVSGADINAGQVPSLG